MTRVRSRYDRVWVVGRTYLRGAKDLGRLHRIQDAYSITPLSKFGTRFKPRRHRKVETTPTAAHIPGTQAGEDPLAFYAALGAADATVPRAGGRQAAARSGSGPSASARR